MSYPTEQGKVLDLSSAGLTQLGKLLEAQGVDLTEALKEAETELAGIGNFWGDDDAGRGFHDGKGDRSGYRTRSEDVHDEIRALGKVHAGIGDRLDLMGKNVEVADWDSIPKLPEVPK
ncbi:hypothetical protein OG589_25175 [Sphaerisporangium sp. NBC_01403]|uniref:hypothetical protein n=1 Tax=Sphaerisporangium sp. NBC_01403 TaxID=2903599 RepID=UPI0032511506